MIYTIENDKLRVETTDHGAAIVSFVHKQTGKDVVLGKDCDEAYKSHDGNPYFGATVGRCANRIGNASFEINGIRYSVPANNGPNSLHGGGGPDALTFRDYEVTEASDTKVTYKTFSPDGQAGYPGDLTLYVTYELKDDSLVYSFKGTCTKDSLLNITNHVYFNLDGSGDILSHRLQIMTDRFAVNDINGMASSEVADVKGTSFDFTSPCVISERFAQNDPRLASGGLDHHFVFENMDDKFMAVLSNGDLDLSVYSDLPGIQVYTANTAHDIAGKNGAVYGNFCGIAMECQYYPNAINYDHCLKPVIRAGEEVEHYIRFELRSH